KELAPLLEELEPRHKGYVQLRMALKNFLDSMDRTHFTYVNYPIEIPSDSVAFIKNLQTRLYEGGSLKFNNRPADTSELTAAVKAYQAQHDLKVDGKAGPMVV